MPLLKLFEIIENLLGFDNHEQQYHHHRSTHSKRRLSETTDICTNYVNQIVSHSSVPSSPFPIVSLLFIYSLHIVIELKEIFLRGLESLFQAAKIYLSILILGRHNLNKRVGRLKVSKGNGSLPVILFTY
jgi:hypothetical protein